MKKAIEDRLEKGVDAEMNRVIEGQLQAVIDDNAKSEDGGGKLERLYITGHSLGGALAVLAAALLQRQYPALAAKLSGVYTFGQPMVGDAAFAEACQRDFGGKLFRHVYGHDLVAHLPPLSAGKFVHFGEEYGSTANGWMRRAGAASQTWSFLLSLPLSVFAWVVEQIPHLSQMQLPLPYSLADHAPINYLRTSYTTRPGTELE
jgi:acetyl esterase/lipase